MLQLLPGGFGDTHTVLFPFFQHSQGDDQTLGKLKLGHIVMGTECFDLGALAAVQEEIVVVQYGLICDFCSSGQSFAH